MATSEESEFKDDIDLSIKNSPMPNFPKDLFNWKLVTDEFLDASKGKNISVNLIKFNT